MGWDTLLLSVFSFTVPLVFLWLHVNSVGEIKLLKKTVALLLNV